MKSRNAFLLVALAFVALSGLVLPSLSPAEAHQPCRSCGSGWWWGSSYWGPYPHWYGPNYHYSDGRWRRFAVVDLDVEPEEVEVVLDGNSIGIADDFDGFPDYLYLRPGTYTLEFRLPGYNSFSKELIVEAGHYYDLTPELARRADTPRFGGGWGDNPPPRATRRTFSPKDADQEDDVNEERRPSLRPSKSDDEGDDDEDDDQPIRRPSRVQERGAEPKATPTEEPAAPPATPAPESEVVSLSLDVDPEDAQLWLDGRALGPADRIDSEPTVMPGRHEMVVMKPGYESRVIPIDADEPGRFPIVVRLEKLERSE